MNEISTVNLIPTLSEEECRDIEAEIAHLPDRQSAAIDALRIVQKYRGWVSDESVAAIADLLSMSSVEIDSIATFYNLIYRKPVGRNVVMVCDSVSCFIMDANKVKEALIEKLGIELGQTTQDDRFTLLPIVCLGACDRAPAIMINEDLLYDVSPENLDEILKAYE